MKRKSRQGRIERTEWTNQLKTSLDLSRSPGFGLAYGPLSGGEITQPVDYFTYTHLGYEVRLRFSQVSGQWSAVCPDLEISTNFPNQPPQDIQKILNNWLEARIGWPPSVDAQLRQVSPAVQKLAAKHGISVETALEIYEERGF